MEIIKHPELFLATHFEGILSIPNQKTPSLKRVLGVQTHLSDLSSHLWISFASTPSMKKSSFSSAFLSKMRSKIFSWKDPNNQGENLIGIFNICWRQNMVFKCTQGGFV